MEANTIPQFHRIALKHSCQTHLILLERENQKNQEVFFQFLNAGGGGRGAVLNLPKTYFLSRRNEDIGIIKIKPGMAVVRSLPNDEGVPWPAERKRAPFSIHLAASPDLIQPKSPLNPNLIPAN